MRKIKIRLPFREESVCERRNSLIEMAQILSNNLYFCIIDEKHLKNTSYMIVYVADDVVIYA